MPAFIPLSKITAAARPLDLPVCYSGIFTDGQHLTWEDFLRETAAIRTVVRQHSAAEWILSAADNWNFLTAFAALLQCRKRILLCPVRTPEYLAEIQAATGATIWQTDQSLSAPSNYRDDCLAIDADASEIVLYTSGSTGKPKAITQRLTEFENDNAMVWRFWGEKIAARKFCATVANQHIYGLLFALLFPFTIGTPFRRSRIEQSEELTRFSDTAYVLVTTPSFLKRAVQIVETPMRNVLIFTSGGAVPPEVAAATERTIGFYPIEIYGSTEANGIAWRQSKNGLAWTPYPNVELWLDAATNCLAIRSSFIKDPAGLVTGDLAELLPDGKFYLRGRADAVVKIEEKRVSLTEVETRLLDSGFIDEVAVVALTAGRQFLAAAIVLNAAGKAKFSDVDKRQRQRFFSDYLAPFFSPIVIPKKWRYLEKLPLNEQGKKSQAAIAALFGEANDEAKPSFFVARGIRDETVVSQSDENAAVAFTIAPDSPYFDGHFSELQLLPAVAQSEIVAHFAAKFWAVRPIIIAAKKLKFSRPIFPAARLRLELTRRAATLFSFRLLSAENAAVFSSGTLTLAEIV